MKINVDKEALIRFIKENRNDCLISLIFFFLGCNQLLYSFFGMDQARLFLRLLLVVIMGIQCVYRFFKRKMDLASFIMLGIAGILLFTGGVLALNYAFLGLTTVILKNMKQKSVYKIAFYVNVLLLLLVLFSLAFGIVENTPYVVGERFRLTLGFANVNSASLFLCSILMLMTLFANSNRSVFLFLIGSLSTYIITDSRTSFFVQLFMLLIWFLVPQLSKKWKHKVVLALTVLMFVTPVIWCIPVLSATKLETWLSSRPSVYLNYIQSHNWLNLMFGGSPITEVDNFYLVHLYNGGIFLYLVVAIVVVVAMNRLVNKEKYREIAFCLAMLLMGQFEATPIRPEILIVPIFWLIIIKNCTLSETLAWADELVHKIKTMFAGNRRKQ